ncbi:MAG TPA: alpha/beta fold hydrolase, partial [Amycolatopsis sp.]|nr:alpha/beta fold hydrolase [Amycolatopsis sp.]
MIAVLLAAAVAVSSPAPVTAPDGDVSFTSHGVTLHGTVVAPEGRGGLAPGIVMVHGSGEHDRDDYRTEAEAFAKAGIATLIYDKRTEGYSLFERNYAVLADDALAAVRALRSRPGVDPARVGVWGLSEGGWVAPLAASKSKDVAFAVTVGANGVSPDRQQSWAFETYLRRGGVTGSMVDMVASTNMRTLAGAGLFPEAGYDPVPVLEKVRQPVLGLWGELDRLTPPGEAVRIFRETLERAGNRQYTLKVFPQAQHGLRRTTDGFDKLDGFAPGYL